MASASNQAVTPILVAGHESAHGADLNELPAALPGSVVAPAGRLLQDALSAAAAHSDGPVVYSDEPIVVVPMTFGRDPTMVADAAKTLAWQERSGQRVALADPFGQTDHLVAWLRTAANRIQATDPQAAILISAPEANPFDDAELYRIGHLVRTHGVHNPIEVCIDDAGSDTLGDAGSLGDAGALGDAVARLERLGSDRIVVVPAGFQRSPSARFGVGRLATARFYGPLMSAQSLLRVIGDRYRDALHRFSHGDSGIEAGLQADHGHGYAHSHAFEESSGHSHHHSHSHSPGHPHTHGNVVHAH